MASTSKFSTSGSANPPSHRSWTPKFLYDVFLSFRGIDTRNNFTGHLYDRLVTAGLRTFMDDPELRKGSEISVELMRAIAESRIYIVVFSQNYASSRWCLNELVEIVDHHILTDRLLLPVFYDIQPSDVRHQNGSFQEAFTSHEANYINQPELVRKWRFALRRAAQCSGFDLRSSALGSESRLISMIIKEVLSIVKPKKLSVAKYPIGLDSRVNDVCSLLSLESDHHVQFIGIWGMGGSGKTVIAKALYNEILQSFDSSCFLSNVREHSQPTDGLVHLQEELISRLLMREIVKIGIVDEGKEMIRERLSYKKVLIVIDDTDNLSQVDALAGHRNWFGPGSIIIITTRNQHLLTQVEVDGRYEANELTSEESLELFSWHSFKERFPQEPYAVIANNIVRYSCGLPLALEVLGAFLFGRTIQQWESEWKKLHRIPPTEIQEILKISYDGLEYQEREIFLDIACFFIGTDIDYVSEILNGCGFSSEIGIGILRDRCLLTIDKNNEVRMQNLLRDMGREIIRQQCPLEPGKRSRLWGHQDETDVVMRNMGTEAIEGLSLASPIKEETRLSTENFERMHNLRLLQMDNINFYGNFKHLYKPIRWINWQGCSLKHLPSSLQTDNLVALDLQQSKLRSIWQRSMVNNTFSWMSRLWQGNQISRHLTILNLSHSKCLTSTPDFTRVPYLVTLILEGCTSLLQIDPSIGCLGRLLVLNLKGCEKITNIPSEICKLRLLQHLNLSGCSKLKELPDDIGNIECLRELYVDETAITRLPNSLRYLENLTSLSLRGCANIVYRPPLVVPYLRRLNLRDCNVSDCNINVSDKDIDIFFWCSQLQELDLGGNSLSKLPDDFRMLTNLESLWLDNWSILQSIPNLPPNLQALLAENIG